MQYSEMMNKIKEKLSGNLAKNQEKIAQLKYKQKIIERNKWTDELTTMAIISALIWAISVIVIALLKASPLYLLVNTAISLGVGALGTNYLYKKYDYKNKLKEFSKAQTQKELLIEDVKYDLEIAKLKSQTKMLEKCLDFSNEQNPYLENLFKSYNLAIKDSRSKEEIQLEIEKIRQEINHIQAEIDNINNKSILLTNFCDVKNKSWKRFNFFQAIGGGLTAGLLIEVLPLALVCLSSNYQMAFPLAITMIAAPGIIGGTVGYGIKKWQNKIYLEAYEDIVKDLNKESLPDFNDLGNDKTLSNYNSEVNNLITKSSELGIKADINYCVLEEMENQEKEKNNNDEIKEINKTIIKENEYSSRLEIDGPKLTRTKNNKH